MVATIRHKQPVGHAGNIGSVENAGNTAPSSNAAMICNADTTGHIDHSSYPGQNGHSKHSGLLNHDGPSNAGNHNTIREGETEPINHIAHIAQKDAIMLNIAQHSGIGGKESAKSRTSPALSGKAGQEK